MAIPLPWDGLHDIMIAATDPSWNYESTSVRVIRDTTSPQLILAGADEELFVNEPVLPVTVSMIDSNPGSVTVAVSDGPSAPLSTYGDTFAGTVSLNDGVNTIVIQGTDLAGNQASALTRTVTLDRQPPTVSVLSPLSNAELTGSVAVNVSATDNLSGVASVTLLAAGRTLATLTHPPYLFTLDSVSLPAGPLIITAVVKDRAGNMAEATVPVLVQPQLKVEIDAPLPGAILDRDQIIVRGIVRRNSDQEVGVTINGKIAHLQQQTFAALVPLQVGANTLVMNATDAAGMTAQAAVDVVAQNIGETPRLTVLPASGILMPQSGGEGAFISTLSVDVSMPGAIVNYAWDFTGDGLSDLEGPDLATTSGYYQSPGLYFPAVAVTDSLGNVATATGLVNVLDRAALDPLLQAKWAGMKAALGNGDVEGAAGEFSSRSREIYRQQFSALAPVLPQIVGDMGAITLLRVGEANAIYDLRTVRNGHPYSFQLEFLRDGDGLWRIGRY